MQTYEAVTVKECDLCALQGCSDGRHLVLPDLVRGQNVLLHALVDRSEVPTQELVFRREVVLKNETCVRKDTAIIRHVMGVRWGPKPTRHRVE